VTTATDVVDEVNTMLELAPPLGESRPPASLAVTVLERKPGWRVIDLGELWRYRELLYFLTWRDIKVRYKQTVLGAAWAILQPLATMLVFSLFFGRVAANPSSPVPYSLFVLAGLVPWMFLSNAIATAGQSVVASQSLVTKIYFPRLIIPMGAVGAGLVDFAISFATLVLMMAWFGARPGWSFVLVPFLMLGLVIAALGVGSLLSALTVLYRDFRHVVPFLVQFWMFATPCIYLQQEVAFGTSGRLLLLLNPAYGLIANFRAALLGLPLDHTALAVSSLVVLVLLFLGCFCFRQMEGSFADVI
jgi:lipopolysaccharide transport system permease protein